MEEEETKYRIIILCELQAQLAWCAKIVCVNKLTVHTGTFGKTSFQCSHYILPLKIFEAGPWLFLVVVVVVVVLVVLSFSEHAWQLDRSGFDSDILVIHLANLQKKHFQWVSIFFSWIPSPISLLFQWKGGGTRARRDGSKLFWKEEDHQDEATCCEEWLLLKRLVSMLP